MDRGAVFVDNGCRRAIAGPLPGTTSGHGDPIGTLDRGLPVIRAGFGLLGLITVVRERGRFRRPGLATGAALAALGQAASSAASGGDRGDRAVADELAALAAMCAVGVAAGREDQFGRLVDWSFHLTLWSSAAMGLTTDAPAPAAALVAANVVAYTAVVGRHGRDHARRAVANGLSFAAMYGAARLLVAGLRTADEQIAVHNQRAVVLAEEAAREEARIAAARDWHREAASTIRRVAALWPRDPRTARRAARAEAIRLRSAMSGPRSDLQAALDLALVEATVAGIVLEHTTDIAADVEPSVVVALTEALSGTLRWLADGDDLHATLRVTATADAAVASVRADRVGGLVGPTPPAVDEALTRVGGRLERLGVGDGAVRVVLTVPT